MIEQKGKFIVLYGANNLGKSSQVEMLADALEDQGIQVDTIKYPIYSLQPTGAEIDAVLRQGVKKDELALQTLYAQNRFDYQPVLKKMLRAGKWVVAEDYCGTGLAWGMVRGVPHKDLALLNKGLIKEDLAILLHGERFTKGIEKNHRNETDDEIWDKAQLIHLCLAEKYGWKKVYATRLPENVHQDILGVVKQILF